MSTNPRRRPGFPVSLQALSLSVRSSTLSRIVLTRPISRAVLLLEDACGGKHLRSSCHMDEPVQFDLSVFRDLLVARRREILDLVQNSADSRKPVELDQSRVGRLSRMDALQNQAMSLEAERRRQLELQRIEASLKRIEEGDYGYCISCGEQIPLRRLELDPTLPTCVSCASSGTAD